MKHTFINSCFSGFQNELYHDHIIFAFKSHSTVLPTEERFYFKIILHWTYTKESCKHKEPFYTDRENPGFVLLFKIEDSTENSAFQCA
jgi:hypothetical protein